MKRGSGEISPPPPVSLCTVVIPIWLFEGLASFSYLRSALFILADTHQQLPPLESSTLRVVRFGDNPYVLGGIEPS